MDGVVIKVVYEDNPSSRVFPREAPMLFQFDSEEAFLTLFRDVVHFGRQCPTSVNSYFDYPLKTMHFKNGAYVCCHSL
jgi:hypothetical protein